ncbi:hypothetical protein QBZ16_002913 [Prototheca wickerhamii]|uniref:Uncharacterized protein n=1 Tax=Prototheca wickerhamii TaxID=3111 RepID=A0AAD9IMW6_PROWI|nr:hypothetical protein QBZ16_002913 [Prototheca wickerhamii]
MLRYAAAQLARRAQVVPVAAAKGLRPFAAEAREVVLPPQFSVPGRYAAALYMAASKAGDLDSVTKELSQMAGLLQQSDDFRQFVTDPTVGQNVKIEGLSGVMDGLGATDTTKNFFVLLAENNRLTHVPKILETFQSLVSSQKGQVEAVVTAASELSQSDVSDITASLKAMLKPGQSLSVTPRVDPDILGGLVVDFEDKHIDLSIRSRIQSIEKAVAEAVV